MKYKVSIHLESKKSSFILILVVVYAVLCLALTILLVLYPDLVKAKEIPYTYGLLLMSSLIPIVVNYFRNSSDKPTTIEDDHLLHEKFGRIEINGIKKYHISNKDDYAKLILTMKSGDVYTVTESDSTKEYYAFREVLTNKINGIETINEAPTDATEDEDENDTVYESDILINVYKTSKGHELISALIFVALGVALTWFIHDYIYEFSNYYIFSLWVLLFFIVTYTRVLLRTSYETIILKKKHLYTSKFGKIAFKKVGNYEHDDDTITLIMKSDLNYRIDPCEDERSLEYTNDYQLFKEKLLNKLDSLIDKGKKKRKTQTAPEIKEKEPANSNRNTVLIMLLVITVLFSGGFYLTVFKSWDVIGVGMMMSTLVLPFYFNSGKRATHKNNILFFIAIAFCLFIPVICQDQVKNYYINRELDKYGTNINALVTGFAGTNKHGDSTYAYLIIRYQYANQSYTNSFDNEGIIGKGETIRIRISRNNPELFKILDEYIYESRKYDDKGKELYDAGNYEAAILEYNTAIQIDPRNASAYNNRGEAKLELKQYQEALSDYTKAVSLDNQNVDYYDNLGWVKYKTEDYTGAILDYNTAIELNPEAAYVYVNRGAAKFDMNDYAGALADYNKGIELNDNISNAYQWRGELKQKLGDEEGAQLDFEKAKQLNSK